MAALPAGNGFLRILALAAGILVGKALIVTLVVLVFRHPPRVAAATGLTLAQIGEFSFVLAELGRSSGLLAENTFQLLLSASVITLLLTPYLVEAAPRVAEVFVRALAKLTRGRLSPAAPEREEYEQAEGRVIVVGYGPAGQGAVEALRAAGVPFLVIDLNARTVDSCRSTIPIVFGDATRPEVLEHARVELARAILVTIPDTHTAGLIIGQAKRMAPAVPVIARARYHIHSSLLLGAGADQFVDEEYLVGERLGAELTALVER